MWEELLDELGCFLTKNVDVPPSLNPYYVTESNRFETTNLNNMYTIGELD